MQAIQLSEKSEAAIETELAKVSFVPLTRHLALNSKVCFGLSCDNRGKPSTEIRSVIRGSFCAQSFLGST